MTISQQTLDKQYILLDPHNRFSSFFTQFFDKNSEVECLLDYQLLDINKLSHCDMAIFDFEGLLSDRSFVNLATALHSLKTCQTMAICGSSGEEQFLDRLGFDLVLRTPFSDSALTDRINSFLSQ